MKRLHLCLDHNFIEQSRDIFEKYYPNENIFLINKQSKDFKIIKDKKNFLGIPYGNKEYFEEVWGICVNNDINDIVIHGMSKAHHSIIKFLSEKKRFKIYWIFWGYELYQTLGFKHGYRLNDESFSLFNPKSYLLPNKITYFLRKLVNKDYIPKAFEFLIGKIDYFCFWNKFDFDLMNKYYHTNMEFRFFSYGGVQKGTDLNNILFPLEERATSVIMVNHQASQTGNHGTVMRRIKEIDSSNLYVKLVPLSYGSVGIKQNVQELGKKLFKDKFEPIMTYMALDEYNKKLASVDIAFFGQHRQEAAGNIIQLLRNGVKVFLRNDNSLLNYYRSLGYLVYSFEDDFNSINDLKSLSISEKQHNRDCYLSHINYFEDFMPTFFD